MLADNGVFGGSRNLIEIHGRADRVRRPRPGCPNGAPAGSLPRVDFDLEGFLAAPSPATLPLCPHCQAIMRQHLLWFDGFYDSHDDYQWSRVFDAAEENPAPIYTKSSPVMALTWESVAEATGEFHEEIGKYTLHPPHDTGL
jgi:NAD-dependent deacetylase